MTHQVIISFLAKLNVLYTGNSVAFDYISVTPPYTQVDYGVLMRQISESVLIGDDSFIVSYSISTCRFLVKLPSAHQIYALYCDYPGS